MNDEDKVISGQCALEGCADYGKTFLDIIAHEHHRNIVVGYNFKEGSEGRNSYRKPIAVRFDLIPPVFLRDLAEVYEEGAQNYGDAKYIEKPLPFSSIINHMENHFNLWLSGDRLEKHLAKVAWGCATLTVLEELILANEMDKNIADVTKYGAKVIEALRKRYENT